MYFLKHLIFRDCLYSLLIQMLFMNGTERKNYPDYMAGIWILVILLNIQNQKIKESYSFFQWKPKVVVCGLMITPNIFFEFKDIFSKSWKSLLLVSCLAPHMQQSAKYKWNYAKPKCLWNIVCILPLIKYCLSLQC